MNAKVIGILSFIAGAVAGSAGTYFLLKKYVDKRIEDEVNEVVDYYHNRDAEVKDEPAEDIPEVPSSDDDEIVKQRNVKVDANVEPDYGQIIEKLNYNKYSTIASDGLNPEPYIISMDDYNNSAYDNEKETVSWFIDDEVLMDTETNKMIGDIDRCVGFSNLELFGKSDGADDDELYVRNEKLGVDYYIVMETGSYSDYIASIEGE